MTRYTFLVFLQEQKESTAFDCVPNLLTSPHLSWLIKPQLRRISLTQDIFQISSEFPEGIKIYSMGD